MAKISIIVPVHNVEKYLKQCIDSILKQTIKDIEVILVNDHSKDKSLQICKEYQKKDNRIKLIDNDLYGVSEARNVGIANATGMWLAFVDSDDWLEHNMLEVLYNKSKEVDSDIIMCGAYINYKNCKIKNGFYFKDYNFLNDLDKEKLQIQAVTRVFGENYKPKHMVCGVPWAKIYKKSFVQKNKLKFNPRLIRMQDMIFNLYAFEFANSIEYINMNLYNYRKNLSSACGIYDKDINKKEKAALEELDIFIKMHKNNQEIWKDVYYKKMFDGLIYRIFMQDILSEYNTDSWLRKRKRMLKTLKEDYNECLTNLDKNKLSNYQNKFRFLLKYHLVFIYYIYDKMQKQTEKKEYFD